MASKALCIGINDYPGSGSDLAGCVNDARDWAQAFAALGLPATSLHDKDATARAIRDSIRAVIAQAGPGDTVMIQYSGHGSFVADQDGDETDGTDECICPYDYRTDLVTDDQLFELFDAKKPGVRIVMISDSCHSGTVTRFNPILTPPTTTGGQAPQRKVRFLPPGQFLDVERLSGFIRRGAIRRSGGPGRYSALLLSGCQDAEYSYDAYFNGRPNGAFTFVALQALASLAADATFTDWFKAIRTILPSQQYPQRPNLYGSRAMKEWRIPGSSRQPLKTPARSPRRQAAPV